MVRFRTEADLLALISDRIPEAASLEYKSELALGSDGQRVETLSSVITVGPVRAEPPVMNTRMGSCERIKAGSTVTDDTVNVSHCQC